ncbi:MAG: rRNA maturation RNase YbeY [Spirochaetota bacterium]
MSSDITIINKSAYRIACAPYRTLLRKLLRALCIRKSVGLLFTDNKGIRVYNRNFRGKDKATDVLSFPGEGGHLGDIIISYEWVVRERPPHRRTAIEELIVHAVLHLTGVHHTYTERSLAENRRAMDALMTMITAGR